MKIGSHSNLFDVVRQRMTQVNKKGYRRDQTRVKIESLSMVCIGRKQKLDEKEDCNLSADGCEDQRAQRSIEYQITLVRSHERTRDQLQIVGLQTSFL